MHAEHIAQERRGQGRLRPAFKSGLYMSTRAPCPCPGIVRLSPGPALLLHLSHEFCRRQQCIPAWCLRSAFSGRAPDGCAQGHTTPCAQLASGGPPPDGCGPLAPTARAGTVRRLVWVRFAARLAGDFHLLHAALLRVAALCAVAVCSVGAESPTVGARRKLHISRGTRA